MKQVMAFVANNGKLYLTREDALRHDEAELIKPLYLELESLLKRAEVAGLNKEFGLLEWIKNNFNAISTFKKG